LLLDKNAQVLDRVAIWHMGRDRYERDSYLVLTHPENTSVVLAWLRGLSDGYALFDDGDVWRKVRGPATVELWSEVGETRMAAMGVYGPQAKQALAQLLGGGEPAALPEPGRIAPIQYGDQSVWVACAGPLMGEHGYGLFGAEQILRAVGEALIADGALLVPKARVTDSREQGEGACAFPLDWQGARDVEDWLEECPHLFERSKAYFVGQHKLPAPQSLSKKAAFAWVEPEDVSLKRTPLHAEHEALGAKLIGFAGWEMPVWYSGVGTEHQAVRERAGLFDVGHMGTIEVSGPHAVDFLDLVTVNYPWRLKDGRSQYSGLLDAEGQILDDVIVYRRAWDRFLVVVNAVNFDKDWAWLNAVNEGQVILDVDRPWVGALHRVTLRDLHDAASGGAQCLDIALQGPASRDILLACIEDERLRRKVARLRRTLFVEGELNGIPALISQTGYTGEDVGYELYVHPERAVELWRLLLERGATFGIQPCGLAARDSTRIEAGLPLYGHELAGPLAISQNEAGFGSYVKYHKPFFVGRDPYKTANDASTRGITRFQVSERGARALRGGEPVVNRRGRVIGQVTSCALVGERQIGMALVEARYTEPGAALYLYPETRRAVSKAPEDFEAGDTVALPVLAEVLERFPAGE
jgi:glycine hydroxymethyltransferase